MDPDQAPDPDGRTTTATGHIDTRPAGSANGGDAVNGDAVNGHAAASAPPDQPAGSLSGEAALGPVEVLAPAPGPTVGSGDGAPAGTDGLGSEAIGGSVGNSAGAQELQPNAIARAGQPREEVPWLIIWSAIGVVLAAAAAIEMISALRQVIELIVISGFLAVVLSPAVSGLVRIKIRRGLATTVVFLLGMAAFGGLGYLFIHPLYREATHLANDLPGTLQRVQAGKGRIGSIVTHYHLQSDAQKYIPKIKTYLSHLGGPALSVARTVLSGLGGLVVLAILTFLMLLEGPSAVKGILRILPAPYGRRTRRILDDIAKSVTGYVIGNFATSVIAGAVCFLTLLVLGVPFAVVFGVWVALVDLLPLVGGLLAGVPTVAFAFLFSPADGIITLIVFLVYQQVENHILNPVIMSRTVKLNPLWVLLSVLAGAELAGILGALLAIPAAGAIHVIARDIWDERGGKLKVTPTVGPDQTPIA